MTDVSSTTLQIFIPYNAVLNDWKNYFAANDYLKLYKDCIKFNPN
jgi:hypothetical protein